MKTFSMIIAAIAMLVGVSCSETYSVDTQNDAQRLSTSSIPDIEGSHNVYYRNTLYKIDLLNNYRANPAMIVESGQTISKVFYTDKYPSALVLDALNKRLIQNAMLYVIQFKDRVQPRQLYSMAEIETAYAKGEITLTNTEALYLFTRLE